MASLFHEVLFWEALAFVIFLGVAFKFGWGPINAALDARTEAIRNELDQARRLREEAQSLLAEYQRKRRDAEKEAEEIVQHAKEDAAALRVEAERKLEESLARRTLLAEEKIGRAEQQAIQEIRHTAIDVAVAAAQTLIAANLDEARAKALVDDAIEQIQGNVH
ncbi:MAG: F0F1 ATP synthase subunit B [Proteobacteria bacterium]|nr:F0F1 ATP synthase subunit B [Pseudomonadota bacterium]